MDQKAKAKATSQRKHPPNATNGKHGRTFCKNCGKKIAAGRQFCNNTCQKRAP